jgi:PAS domain S-box-containing protein
MKILYVEDNITDADLTRRQLLEDMPGCELVVVRLLSEAERELAPGNDYDLVLLDMHLPDCNGMDLLIRIRQENLDVAVIVLTGSGDEEVAVTALKAGADNYVVKKNGYLDSLSGTIEIALVTGKANHKKKQQILNVLYVEHNTSDIKLTKRHLNRYAPYFNLTVCFTADEALEALKESTSESCKYDILLTDYRLRGYSGLELVKTVRQIKKLPIAVIIVSGQGDEDIAIQALHLGADEYLVKRSNYLFRLPSMLMSAFQRHELEKNYLALQKSEERYRRLTENAQDIIFRYEFLPVCRFSYVSPAATKITGYTPEEHYADADLRYKLVHPDDIHLLKNASEYPAHPLILRWIKKNGTIIWIDQRNLPIFDEQGNLKAIEGIARDITGQKLAEDKLISERILLRTLIDNLPDNIYVKDTQMRKLLVNKADLALIGKPEEEVIGKDDSALFPAEIAGQFMADDRLVLEKGQPIINREEMLVNNLGQKIWLLTSKLPLYDQERNITGIIGIGHNITGRKQAEELLKEREQKLKEKNEEYQALNHEYLIVNDELTESIRDMRKMNEDLRIAKEKAEESDRLKTAFLTNMSHEIRTPMNAILGFTKILRKISVDTKKREYYLDIINRSCDRLLSVVNDIIDISRIESGIIALQYSNINVNELLNEMYNYHYESCKNKNLSLVMQNHLPDNIIYCRTDEPKLQQILSNLIDNGIKFTEKGGISVTYEMKDNMIEFSIEDTGIGIKKKNQKIIYDRFRQADENYTKEYGGTGLGLAIAKAYVNRLGGKIWLKSAKGKGTTFCFNIPYIPVTASEISQNKVQEAQCSDWSGKKILVAEDEISNYEYIAEVLESTRIKIFHAKNGKEAIDIFEANNPDLILMDIKMPKINGMLATKIIRDKNKKIPVIALTAYELDIDREKAMKAGFNDYISKPVYFEKLLSVLDYYLN